MKPRRRIFFDFEFHKHGNQLDLLSAGFVAEGHGPELYMEFRHSPVELSSWLREHVCPKMNWESKDRISPEYGALLLQTWIEDMDCTPEFWAYFSAHDWVCLCDMFGGMVNVPKAWPHLAMDLQQHWLTEHNANRTLRPKKMGPTKRHNALEDARWDRLFYERMERG